MVTESAENPKARGLSYSGALHTKRARSDYGNTRASAERTGTHRHGINIHPGIDAGLAVTFQHVMDCEYQQIVRLEPDALVKLRASSMISDRQRA